MKINRVFLLKKEKINFRSTIKKLILNYLKIFDLFIISFKNFLIFKRNLSINSRYIYLIDNEKIKDYEINISKIAQNIKPNSFFEPINKSTYLCEALQIDIYNGSKIYNLSNFSASFELHIRSKKSKKIKNYSINFDKKDLRNIIKTKKWLSIKIKLNKIINFKNNKVLIKFKKLQIDNNHKNKKYLSFRSIGKDNLKHSKVIFIVLDGLSNFDLRNYINNFSTKHIFKKLLQDSIYYKNSITGSTVTGSSLPSLLTNSSLLQHGMYKYESHLYKHAHFPSKNLKFLAEEFLNKGYFTHALTNFSRMRPHFGMNIGFQDYTNICTNNFHTSVYFEKMLELLKSAENEKSFTFFHYIGAHPPFHSEINLNEKKQLDNEENFYYSNISKSELFLEAIINQLKQKNLYENTTLIVTSDHGKTLKNFNKSNFHFYEERLSVPLIYKPRSSMGLKFKGKTINKRVINHKEIYSLINKYEKIQLNKQFYFQNYDNILWTTVSSSYDNLNSFVFVGYDKAFKWIFKCILEDNNYFKLKIIDQPIAFSISKSNKINENKNIYPVLSEFIKKKVKRSLYSFIKKSKFKNLSPEKQNENMIYF